MSSPVANDAAAADEKPRLTEEEKKQNHIASGKLLFRVSGLDLSIHSWLRALISTPGLQWSPRVHA